MVLALAASGTVYGVYGIWLSARAESVRWRTLLATLAVLSGAVAIRLPVQGLTRMF